MDLNALKQEAEGWAFFYFALQLWGRLPQPLLFEDEFTKPHDDRVLAKIMLEEAVKGGVLDFRDAKISTEIFLKRRYRGAPDEIVPEAMGALEHWIKHG